MAKVWFWAMMSSAWAIMPDGVWVYWPVLRMDGKTSLVTQCLKRFASGL
jgi:hypothetical protein